jgi:hypothetical protein
VSNRKPLNADPTQRIETVPPVEVLTFSHMGVTIVLELYPYPTHHLTVTRMPNGVPLSHQIQLSPEAYAELLAEMSKRNATP